MSLENEVSIKKVLPIHVHQDGEVDNEHVNVRKSQREEIEWHSEGDELRIDFTVSPFEEHSFHVPAGGSVCSGPVRDNAPIDRYQYFITNISLAKSADPIIEIKP